MEEVEVRIKSDGSVEIGVRGVGGRKCEEVTRSLEAVLGGAVVERSYTEEYYQEETETAEEVHVRETR